MARRRRPRASTRRATLPAVDRRHRTRRRGDGQPLPTPPGRAPASSAGGRRQRRPSGRASSARCSSASGCDAFRAAPGGRLPRGRRGPRRAAGDAHRRRQVALLPAPRPGPRRHHAGRQPAHRADGGPGRQAAGAGAARRAHPLGPRPRRVARRSAAPTSTGQLDFLFIAPERLARARASPRCSPSASRRWSPSTRPTASRSGATTSGPTTACSASACRRCAPRRSSRSPPPPRRACRTTSSTQLGLGRPRRFIHGFRRDEPRHRGGRACRRASAPEPRGLALLRDAARRPGHRLRPHPQGGRGAGRGARRRRPRAAPYHAGLRRRRASAVQTAFLARRARGRRGDHRLRHGHRQGRHPHRGPHGAARRASRATTRRSAAPAATASRRARCCSTPAPTAARTSSSSSATTPTAAVLEKAVPGARRASRSPRRACRASGLA